MHVQRPALQVDIGVYLLLDLLKHVVAGGIVDGEFLVLESIVALHREAAALFADVAQDVLHVLVGIYFVRHRLPEQPQPILALQPYAATVRADALHIALELGLQLLIVAQLYLHRVAHLHLVFDFDSLIHHHSGQHNHRRVRQRLHAPRYLHALQKQQLVAAHRYAMAHLVHYCTSSKTLIESSL